MFDPADLMKLAIDKCRAGIAAGQGPFGCAIARGDQLLSVAHNTVRSTTDITAHAEINAIRMACLQTGQIFLDGAVVATTCEPCPMCTAALHWARVEVVYFGATIQDAKLAGFNELRVAAADVLELGGSQVKLVSGVCAQPCQELFADWQKGPHAQAY